MTGAGDGTGGGGGGCVLDPPPPRNLRTPFMYCSTSPAVTLNVVVANDDDLNLDLVVFDGVRDSAQIGTRQPTLLGMTDLRSFSSTNTMFMAEF